MLVDSKFVLEQSFENKWVPGFYARNQKEKEEWLKGLLEEFFAGLHNSVFCGEFAVARLDAQIDALKKSIDELRAHGSEQMPSDVNYAENTNLIFVFHEAIENGLINYSKFINRVSEKVSTNHHVVDPDEDIWRTYNVKTDDINPDKNSKIEKRLFQFNLVVADIDYHLVVEKRLLIWLTRVLRYCESKEYSASTGVYRIRVIQLLKDKCSFLLNRLSAEMLENQPAVTIHEDEPSPLEIKSIEDEGLRKLSHRINLYNLEKLGRKDANLRRELNADFDIIERQLGLTHRKGAKVKVGESREYYMMSRYLKYFGKSIQKYENEVFPCEHDVTQGNLHDEHGRKSCNCYYRSDFLSLLINFSVDETKVRNAYEDSLGSLNTNGINNYYPHFKIAGFYLKLVEEKMRSSNLKEHVIAKIDIWLGEAERAMEMCMVHFDWCSSTRFVPLQLPFSDSVVEIAGDSPDQPSSIKSERQKFLNKIFISSIVVDPIDYSLIRFQIENLKQQLFSLKTLRKLYATSGKLDEELKSFRVELKENAKQQISILSIFAAIVVLASGSVQIFQRESITTTEAILFTLCFAYTLVTFTIAIWLITRDDPFQVKSLSTSHIILITIFVIVTVFLVAWVIGAEWLQRFLGMC